jgi:hypothetical protein
MTLCWQLTFFILFFFSLKLKKCFLNAQMFKYVRLGGKGWKGVAAFWPLKWPWVKAASTWQRRDGREGENVAYLYPYNANLWVVLIIFYAVFTILLPVFVIYFAAIVILLLVFVILLVVFIVLIFVLIVLLSVYCVFYIVSAILNLVFVIFIVFLTIFHFISGILINFLVVLAVFFLILNSFFKIFWILLLIYNPRTLYNSFVLIMQLFSGEIFGEFIFVF